MRVLEVSLRKAGFTVTTASSVQDALDKLELDAPDLIISETAFPDGDGFELRRRVRGRAEWAEIPFIFLTAEVAIENKIRGLELGVDDYLTKPIYIKEIVTRINILLQKRQRARFEERRDGRTRFAGRVADMPVVDVIQTIEISRKSGVIQFSGERGRQAAIYFRDGRVIDAEAGTLQGEDAVYRLLTWSEGEFEVVFRTVRRREVIQTSSQGLLMEGMRRLDEWSRLLEQLPPLTHRFEVDAGELAQRLGDVPDDNNSILRLIDGKRTLVEVIEASDVGDLECLQAISRLYFEELLIDLDHGTRAKRDTGKPVPLVEVEAATPIEEVASGPIPIAKLAAEAEPPTAATTDETPPGATEAPGQEAEPRPPVDAPAEAAEPTRPSDALDAEADIIEEESAPGALLGGYRQSSLRLIDEAVAAAQAIEPSLFEDEVDALINGPNTSAAPKASAAPDDSVPHAIEHDEPSPPTVRARRSSAARAPASEPLVVPRPGREESGLRMIGSLGRDRAETSGEVHLGGGQSTRAETQRELVTIMPRRQTREIPIVSATDEPSVTFKPKPAVEPPKPVPMHLPSGTGVVAHRGGPGRGALALLALAGLLGIVALVLYLGRGSKPTTSRDASVLGQGGSSLEHDALVVESAPDAAPSFASFDAALAKPADAKPADAKPADAKPAEEDPQARNNRARELFVQGTEALKESKVEEALRLADAALQLRNTARAQILRAWALFRLKRLDEALAALDKAEQIQGAEHLVIEARANILWAAGRQDEATAEMRRYLDLGRTDKTVTEFKQRLGEL